MISVFKNSFSSFNDILEYILAAACIFSGVSLFAISVSEKYYLLLFLGIFTYSVSLVTRRFLTKPKYRIRISELGYLLFSIALAGSILSFLMPMAITEFILPADTLSGLSPFMLILVVGFILGKFLKNKLELVSIVFIFFSILVIIYFYNDLILIFDKNILLSSLLYGSPSLYMVPILLGLYKPNQKI